MSSVNVMTAIYFATVMATVAGHYKFAAFNIQTFGKAKMSKPDVVNVIKQVNTLLQLLTSERRSILTIVDVCRRQLQNHHHCLTLRRSSISVLGVRDHPAKAYLKVKTKL